MLSFFLNWLIMVPTTWNTCYLNLILHAEGKESMPIVFFFYTETVNMGVPQETILGAPLFLIHINYFINSTMELPRRLGSDNGSLFNSKEFSEFAKQEEFKNHRMTALHPRANGKVESFMENLNKSEQLASVQGKNRLERRNAVQDMLIAYRSTSHPATEVPPYEAVKGTPVRTKLDYTEPETQRNAKDDITDQRVAEYK